MITTHGSSLASLRELSASNNSISELYLDFDHRDYTKDLKRFFLNYPGSNLKVLEVCRMSDPIELDSLSETCPNLQRLKIMLCGVWEDDKLFWMYFSRLTNLHIKTSSTETLLSFMKYNISVCDLKISCPNEVKSKFTDSFIQNACSRRGFLPCLKTLTFASKFPFGFQSAQRLIESLESLQFIGPMEMFSKLSKLDVLDLVKWVKDHNWNIVISFKSVEYNVFEIDLSDPWKYKFVPDPGRIPVRKPATKRLLSVPSFGGSEESEESSSSDGRKRSRRGSFYPSPSQASTTRVASIRSLKKSIDHEITEFEFEFCLDSDGFIKNKDYKMPANYHMQAREDPKTGDFDEYYTDYDSEFDEDTMDVEDIPEDADFEWCWDEEGRLRIDEIEKEERTSLAGDHEEQALPEQVVNGVTLDESEKESLGILETELSYSSGKVEKLFAVKNVNVKAELDESAVTDNAVTETAVTESLLQSKSEESEQTGDQQTSSSRRAKKRFAQITPPPNEEGKKETVGSSVKTPETFRSQIIPAKAAKADKGEVAKSSKIASYQGMFEKQKENNNSGTSLNRNRSASNVIGLAGSKQKAAAPVVAVQKTQVIEVFEYDPMLGYCTVKRKTVPVTPAVTEPPNTPSTPVSANLSFLQTKEESPAPTLPAAKTDVVETSLTEPISGPLSEPESQPQEVSEVEQGDPVTSSGTSSKENKIPNTAQTAGTADTPMIPLSSMSKYDIPFLNNLLCQKGIPEPPKSKPPKLPKSVDSKLPMPKISHSSSSSVVNTPVKADPPKKETPAVAAIKVSAASLETEVHVTVSKPPEPTKREDKEKGLKEAKEWYWDYDENCWKECDPDEEYEWEYIDDDDNDENKNAASQEIQATVKLSEKSRSQQNISETSKELRNSTDSVTKRERKGGDLPKDEGKTLKDFFFSGPSNLEGNSPFDNLLVSKLPETLKYAKNFCQLGRLAILYF